MRRQNGPMGVILWLAVAMPMTLAVAASAAQTASGSDAAVPTWAFPRPQTFGIPGSDRSFSEIVLFDRTRAVDWYPDQHPPMPDAVRGRVPLYACGYCHQPDGGGRAENAALAGLPEAYIERQLAEMKSGARAYDPHFTTGVNMVLVAKLSADDDIAAAARYFAGLTYRKRVKVTEASEIPRATANSVYFFAHDGTIEALGQRIIEGPDDPERFERRDPHVSYTAYVPVGAIARGASLAAGAGGQPACETCHGAGLKGSPIAPPLAGRFATGLFRQLYDFKTGLRHGSQALLMQPVVAQLGVDDMISLAAYAASLEP
jgi:cytochrome c553